MCVCVCVHYTPAGFQQMGCVPVFICVCVHVCVFCMCVHVCDKVCTHVVCVFDVPYGVCNKRNGGSSVPLVNTHTQVQDESDERDHCLHYFWSISDFQ